MLITKHEIYRIFEDTHFKNLPPTYDNISDEFKLFLGVLEAEIDNRLSVEVDEAIDDFKKSYVDVNKYDDSEEVKVLEDIIKELERERDNLKKLTERLGKQLNDARCEYFELLKNNKES